MTAKIKIIFIVSLILLTIFGFKKSIILAYVMSSTNYRIQQDAIDIGGGLGTSSSYKLEDTLGEVGTGYSTSTSYNLHAGYQQAEESYYITLTVPDSTTLSPAISGLIGGQANGASNVKVSTNNPGGYTLQIKASTSPALHCTTTNDDFANYTPTSSAPDFSWSNPPTSASFGFSPKGDNVISRYQDDGFQCNQGALQTSGKCWDPVYSTNMPISQSATPNAPNFTTTTFNFRAEQGNAVVKQPCVYHATIIATAFGN